jgi:anti-sigma B factor antagonist
LRPQPFAVLPPNIVSDDGRTRRHDAVGMVDGHDLPTPFEVRLTPDRDRLVVAPRGELDIATAKQMSAALLEQFDNGFAHVVADLRELTFIDSTGIRVLWQAHQRSAQDGTRLSLIPGNGNVGRVLQIMGLLEHMDLLDR